MPRVPDAAMILRRPALAILARVARLAVLACVTLAAGQARADCLMNRVAQLPITLWRDKLYVPVVVDGTTVMMFIDTGAAVTTVSKETAESLHLPRDFDNTVDVFGVGGKESHLYIAHTQSLMLGAVKVTDKPVPIAAFGELLADGSAAGGLVGADILSHFDLDIDINHRQLGLWNVAGCDEVKPDWGGMTSSSDITVAPSRHVVVPVKLGGVSVNLLLDTGSPGLVVSTRAAARAGATPEMLEESRPLRGHGVNDAAFSAFLHIFPRLEVAGQVFGDARAVVVNSGRVDMGGDGLLGVEFLKRGRFWVSYSTSRFFVERQSVE